MGVNVCVCVFALQVHWLQPAEIPGFPWMAVATGKVESLATLWPFLVIQVMNCKGRAESPASEWKIDTTGSLALRAVSVRAREITGAGREGRMWRRQRVEDVGGLVEESWWKEQAVMGGVSYFISFLELKLIFSLCDVSTTTSQNQVWPDAFNLLPCGLVPVCGLSEMEGFNVIQHVSLLELNS